MTEKRQGATAEPHPECTSELRSEQLLRQLSYALRCPASYGGTFMLQEEEIVYTLCINDHSENIRVPVCHLFIQGSEIRVFNNFQQLGWGSFLVLCLFALFIS